MKKLLSLAAALALTAAVLSCSMVVVRASDHYGWQEGEPTPYGGFYSYSRPRYDFLHRAQLLSRL